MGSLVRFAAVVTVWQFGVGAGPSVDCGDLCVGFSCESYSHKSCSVVEEDFGCECAGCRCGRLLAGNGTSNGTKHGSKDFVRGKSCPATLAGCATCDKCFSHAGACLPSGKMSDDFPKCAENCGQCAGCFPGSRCGGKAPVVRKPPPVPKYALLAKNPGNCSDGTIFADFPESCADALDDRTCCEARAGEGWCADSFLPRGKFSGYCRWTCRHCEGRRVDYSHLGHTLGPGEGYQKDIFIDFETATGKIMLLFYSCVLVVTMAVMPCVACKCRRRYKRRPDGGWRCATCGAANGARKCRHCGRTVGRAPPMGRPIAVLVIMVFGIVLGSIGSFMALAEDYGKAEEMMMGSPVLKNITIETTASTLDIHIDLSIELRIPETSGFKIDLGERVMVITYVHEYVQLPIGSLTIPAVALVPGQTAEIRNVMRISLRWDDFWGQFVTSQFFTKPADLAFGPAQVDVTAETTSGLVDWIMDTSNLQASYVWACNGSMDFRPNSEAESFSLGNCTGNLGIDIDMSLFEYFMDSMCWMGGCFLLLGAAVFEHDLRRYAADLESKHGYRHPSLPPPAALAGAGKAAAV